MEKSLELGSLILDQGNCTGESRPLPGPEALEKRPEFIRKQASRIHSGLSATLAGPDPTGVAKRIFEQMGGDEKHQHEHQQSNHKTTPE
jgi:hypothetical protein